jgi:putative ABC transport system permease protein
MASACPTLVGVWYPVWSLSASRLVTRTPFPRFPASISYEAKIRSVPGIKAISTQPVRRRLYHREEFFPNFAVDARTYLDLYPEFILTAGEEVHYRLKGALSAGASPTVRLKMATWSRPQLTGPVEFVVRGITTALKRAPMNAVFLHWDY